LHVEFQDEYFSLPSHSLICRTDGLLSSTKSLVQTINSAKLDPDVEVVIAPPSIYLLLVKEHLTNNQIQLAAQNVFDKAQGAYTGEIS
jgi:triosephosphate isomerase (TIM)